MLYEGYVLYGRILGFIVTCEQDSGDIELCSREFKTDYVSYTTLLHQQSADLGTHTCILNNIHLLTNEGNISIAYLDFVGRNVHISQMFKMNDEYVAHRVGKVIAVRSLLELEILRKAILDLHEREKIVLLVISMQYL